MTIDAINASKAAMPQAEMTTATTDATSQADVDAFTRALFGQTRKTPEIFATDNLHVKSQEISKALNGTHSMEQMLNNPADMLASQSKMLRSIIEVDLIAKTAGSVSQGVNKLTSMQ